MKKSASRLTISSPFSIPTARPERLLEWLGGVTYDNLYHVLGDLKSLVILNPHEEIQLLVSSFGGATGIGMTFYDTVRWLRANITTIGSGDVDSSGVLIFLSGSQRLLSKNTTLLFHLAGRTFSTDRRFTTSDMEAALKEDHMKDYQYASVVAESSRGRLSTDKVIEMMQKNTILTAEEAVEYGLADAVIS